VSRYDHEQRVVIVHGPYFRCTGVTQLPLRTDPPDHVRVRLDTSERDVLVPREHVRPALYQDDSSGIEGAT